MSKTQRLVRLIVKFFAIICLATTVIIVTLRLQFVYFSTSSVSNGRLTFYATKFFFDGQVSPIFEIILMTQVFLCFITTSATIGFDSLFIVAVFHLCDQLNVFRLDIKNSMFLSGNKFFEARIKAIVERYLQLIRYNESIALL